jgi:dihydropyrimidinase
MVVWDPQGTQTLSVKTQHSLGDFNIFEGMHGAGKATHTLSRGKLVWADGDLRAVRGAGQYIKRPPSAAIRAAARKAPKLEQPVPVARIT